MALSPVTRLVRKRSRADCGLAALATFIGEPYEAVYAVAIRLDRKCRSDGINQRELIATARTLGRKLRRKHTADLEDDEGILSVLWNKRKEHGGVFGHYVVLRNGLAIDPEDNTITPVDEYLAVNNGRPGTILVEET